jgi:hypothetical protein
LSTLRNRRVPLEIGSRNENARRPGRNIGIMGAQERQDLEDRLQMLEAEKNGQVNGLPERLQRHMDPSRKSNPRRLDFQINRIKRLLSEGAPDSPDKYDQQALEKEKVQLEDWLKGKMVPVTGTELRPGPRPEFRKAVNLMAKNENSTEFHKKAMRWKEIVRQLEPEDPDAENLENIRPPS